MDRATSEFIEVDGGLRPAAVTALLDLGDQRVVVVTYQGNHWLCTAEEVRRLVRWAPSTTTLGRLLAERYKPAAVTPAALLDPGIAGRVVLTGEQGIAGVILDGPQLWLGTDDGEEPSFAMGGVDEPGSSLGPSRGSGKETGAGAPEDEPWYVETRFPRQVQVDSATSLVVDITQQPDAGPQVSALMTDISVGTEVGVVVRAKSGFEIVGPSEGKLVAGEGGLPLRFQLRATTEGQGKIRVLFFVEATALGAITLEPVVAAGSDPDPATIASSEVVSALSVGSGRPDLELLVLEEASDGRPKYSIRVTAADERLGIHLREFGPIELHTDARRFFAEMFADIEALTLSTSDDRAQAQRLLESKGAYLFSTLYRSASRHCCGRSATGSSGSVSIPKSPHIPWELIRLSGPDGDGTIVEGQVSLRVRRHPMASRSRSAFEPHLEELRTRHPGRLGSHQRPRGEDLPHRPGE